MPPADPLRFTVRVPVHDFDASDQPLGLTDAVPLARDAVHPLEKIVEWAGLTPSPVEDQTRSELPLSVVNGLKFFLYDVVSHG